MIHKLNQASKNLKSPRNNFWGVESTKNVIKNCFHKGVSVCVIQAEKLRLITMYLFWCQYICFRLFHNVYMLFIQWNNNSKWTYWTICFAVPCGNSSYSPCRQKVRHWMAYSPHILDVPLRSLWNCSRAWVLRYNTSVSVWTLNEWDWFYSPLTTKHWTGVLEALSII